jgi:hypothetical protein
MRYAIMAAKIVKIVTSYELRLQKMRGNDKDTREAQPVFALCKIRK